jgi:hypothetical protein
LLSKELLDLVNSNYQDFLNLGNSLNGGEEKVEEVRVGLLGFRKEVDGLKKVVDEREQEVGSLLEERRDARVKIELGRRLIDYDARTSTPRERRSTGTTWTMCQTAKRKKTTRTTMMQATACPSQNYGETPCSTNSSKSWRRVWTITHSLSHKQHASRKCEAHSCSTSVQHYSNQKARVQQDLGGS